MRLWIKLVLGLAAVALMVWLVVRVGGWTLRFVTNSADSGEADPMFADEATAAPTIPPDLGGTECVAEFHDNSANWDTSVQTPVDRTAGELAEEARAQDEQAE